MGNQICHIPPEAMHRSARVKKIKSRGAMQEDVLAVNSHVEVGNSPIQLENKKNIVNLF